jgi:hypothetical protein
MQLYVDFRLTDQIKSINSQIIKQTVRQKYDTVPVIVFDGLMLLIFSSY